MGFSICICVLCVTLDSQESFHFLVAFIHCQCPPRAHFILLLRFSGCTGIAGFDPAGGAVPVLTPRAPPSHPVVSPVDRSGLQSYVCVRQGGTRREGNGPPCYRENIRTLFYI